jgi:protein TonB
MSTALTDRPPFDSTRDAKRRLPATGMPVSRDRRRLWTVLSIALHLAVIYLLTTDFESHELANIPEIPQGAGGAGPVGGGGGGKRGTGGIKEHVTYVAMAPAPAPTVPIEIPPVTKPLPPVVQQTPVPEVKPVDVIPEPKTEFKIEPPKVDAIAPVAGTGGGSGRDGTTGNGPGTGGGVGSGNGTGRGSGNGPGTGGGSQANYPPSPTEMFIPPLPMPDKVRGFHLVAEYDVDSTGKVVGFNFTPTNDGGYNDRLKNVLKSFKFRPGTTPDGIPIRMKAQIVYDF